jgi:hypothetical protein
LLVPAKEFELRFSMTDALANEAERSTPATRLEVVFILKAM